MKFLNSVIPLLMFFSGVAFLFAGEAQKQEAKVYKLRPTHEALQARQSAVQEKRSPANEGPKALKPEVRVREKGPDAESLVKRSAVLSFGGSWTIVPKGAVLHVPPLLQARVNAGQEGKLLPWTTFYQRNRGWIHVHSVSMEEARGEKKLDPKQVEAYTGLSRVVVSVCHGGPISVVAPKATEESLPETAAAEDSAPKK